MIINYNKTIFSNQLSFVFNLLLVVENIRSATLQLMNTYSFITRSKRMIIYVFTDYEITIH